MNRSERIQLRRGSWRVSLFFIISTMMLYCNQYNLKEKLEIPGGIKRSHYIFVSSYKSTGNLSTLGGNAVCTGTGPAYADCACTEMAKSAGLPASENYSAWLALGGAEADCRLTNDSNLSSCTIANTAFGGPWYNTRDDLVARNLMALLSSGLSAPIKYTEHGNVTDATRVFTGALADGAVQGTHCSGWMNSSGGGYAGIPTATDGSWTSDTNNTLGESCGIPLPIYCLRRP